MNTAFHRHLFIDELYEGFGRSVRQTYDQIDYDLSIKLDKNHSGKLCLPIFIGSSSHGPVKQDSHSNCLIFYYLTRPGLQGMSYI